MSTMQKLCTAPAGQAEVLQGNIAFAAGIVRAGIHATDGYPGTPSSEVIDKGLSQVQDMLTVGWSINEAVASGVAHGHTLAGRDCVVTMKIPGLFQAGDIFTSSSLFTQPRGSLIWYVASDFTPSSTQHTIDPRPLFKSCFMPVFEPRNHQEMHEAASIAVAIGRELYTPVVIMPSGVLCHSEGLVRLMEPQKREPVQMPEDMRSFNCLPNICRVNYDLMMENRMPALTKMVEESPLNKWTKGSGKRGVITYGVNSMYLEEVRELFFPDLDVLSLAFTNPLPKKLIKEFYDSINGDVYVIEDGYRFLEEALNAQGLKVKGKPEYSKITEWSPASIAEVLGHKVEATSAKINPVPRPPMICAGCPYRLFGEEVKKMRKKGKLDVTFGDIGCNSLLYFMNAMDTGLAMGASESKRTGFVLSQPEKAPRCLSIIGDGTECHSGMDATRNAIFRNVAGVKVILDNEWTAMTGGQPSATSPVNLAGDPQRMDINAVLKAHGANVVEVSGYDRKGIQKALKDSLALADEKGEFTTVVVRGTCIRKVPKEKYGQKLIVDADKCKRCGLCNICPGIEADESGLPSFTNLCSGCVSQTPACMQMCPTGAISIDNAPQKAKTGAKVELPEAPAELEPYKLDQSDLPERLSVAIRGVGGQGNLFFGRVLTQLAFLAGYDQSNVVKGETHGMAQMGGPVISTFACGKAYSPQLLPGSADCLVSMEMSEVFRPGFREMLKNGGKVLLAQTAMKPQGLKAEQYPSREAILAELEDFEVSFVDVLNESIKLGDHAGRSANVVMMGVMSKTAPFDVFPESLWLEAIKRNSPKPAIWQMNYAAFQAGRNLV
jgi:indolepyruvate ferredoxin oxidoreductase alpha subunit